MTVRIAYRSDGLVVAVCDRVLVTFVAGEITARFLEEAHQAGKALGDAGLAVGSLTLTSAEVPIPSLSLRNKATEYTRLSNAWVRAGATVVAGVGFRTAAVRSVLVAMTLFTGGPPRKVFDEHVAAVGWLAKEVELPAASTAALRSWLDELELTG